MCDSSNMTSTQKAYLAGFLDGDGSIYVRLKPNPTYRFGYQVSPYIVLFQSSRDREKFSLICEMVKSFGHLRERNDGICEFVINKKDAIREFLAFVKPYILLKAKQAELILEILDAKEKVENKKDFELLAKLVDRFRELNYSKKRKYVTLTP